jgi:hypothetical protein
MHNADSTSSLAVFRIKPTLSRNSGGEERTRPTSRGAPGPKLCLNVASIKQRTTRNQQIALGDRRLFIVITLLLDDDVVDNQGGPRPRKKVNQWEMLRETKVSTLRRVALARSAPVTRVEGVTESHVRKMMFITDVVRCFVGFISF